MIKAFLMLDSTIWIVVIAVLVAYIASLRRRMKGLNEPELWLPKRERQAHARKLLKREEDIYEQQMIARLSEAIKGNQPNLTTE